MSAPSKEDLEKRMMEKMRAIPNPDSNKIKKALEKNRFEDKINTDHTIKVLKERECEAFQDGDRKKLFAAMAVARDQKDQFNVRAKLIEQQNTFYFQKNTIPEEDWELMEPLIEFNDEICIDGNFSESDLHKYFKEEFQINPKYIVKLIELIKIKRKITELEVANESN
jgi:hypothetical protein